MNFWGFLDLSGSGGFWKEEGAGLIRIGGEEWVF